MADFPISGGVIPVSVLFADFAIVHGSQSSKEASYEATGVRPLFGVIIYAINCTIEADIAAVPNGGSFLVSHAFTGAAGNPFYDQGAGADYIGTKVVDPVGQAYLVFRKPVPFETVWFFYDLAVNDSRLYRFGLDRDTGVQAWAPYRSLPERNLDGQMVFSILDPQGVYLYLARLLGFAYTELSYDTSVLGEQFDADTVSQFFLPYLAEQYGLKLTPADTLATKRNKVRNAVQVFKLKGTVAGVSQRLRDFGYTGYAFEVFVNPGDVTAKLVNNANGAAGNIPIVAVSSIQALTVFGMKGGTAVTSATGSIDFQFHQSPITGDTLVISDGTTKQTFYFTNGSAPGGDIAVPFGIDDSATMDNLVAAINANLAITATNVTKTMTAGPPINGQPTSSTVYGTRTDSSRADIQEYPHGYFSGLIPIYYLSSRVSVHINNPDGTPLSYPDTPQGIAAAEALKQQIGSDLSFDVLPAHVDVMFFATDLNVVGPLAKEKVVVTETFSVTHV